MQVKSQQCSEPAAATTHSLQHEWTLWYDAPFRRTTQENWESNIRPVTSVDTLEAFFGMVQHIPEPSNTPHGTNFHFFRRGIKPSWEDHLNASGGKWTLSIPKLDENSQASKLGSSKLWLDTLLACIGDECPFTDQINGAVINIRQKIDRIALWISDTSNESVVKGIGEFFRAYIGLASQSPESGQAHIKITFQSHQDAINNVSKDIYSL